MAVPSSITLRAHGGRLRALITDCSITAGTVAPQLPVMPTPEQKFQAIWDTGATNSCVTQAVIDAAGLVPIGFANVQGVHGSAQVPVYLLDLHLNNGAQFTGVRATRGDLPAGGPQVLIGMDIITLGDFAVTNKDGNTVFSFRTPSQSCIDYVEQQNQKQREEQQRRFRAGPPQPKPPR